MRFVFSLHVDAHTRAHIHNLSYTYTHTTRIHSVFLTLTRGETMFSHDQILTVATGH